MKRIIAFTLIMLAIAYTLERSETLGLNGFKPILEVNYTADEYTLHWPRLPYPAYYKVEALSTLPSAEEDMDNSRLITAYHTWHNQLAVDEHFPDYSYWRVSAQTLFHRPLGKYSDLVRLTGAKEMQTDEARQARPQPTSLYPENSPASVRPMLTWTEVPNAVYYELELLATAPENPNSIYPSVHQISLTREVFTNGYNADFTSYEGRIIYWRVRALDYDGQPIGVFSDAAEVWLDRTIDPIVKPLLANSPPPQLLYPVYSWIPVYGAVSYEVELANHPPDIQGGTEASRHRIWSKIVTDLNDCYDDQPRLGYGKYYWRVRGLDAGGNPVGEYSDTAEFTVDVTKGHYAATFGDSITHGGGAVSYSPANSNYNYQTYLQFPAANLGKSGDTAATMLARFDHDVLPFKPRYLIILGGTNSLRSGVAATQVIAELAGIRSKCLVNGIRPIFLTLPPINPAAIDTVFKEHTVSNWREEFDTVNQFIRQQRYFIDLEPHFTDTNRELPRHLATDGLHLDIEGKKLMGQIINAHWTRVVR